MTRISTNYDCVLTLGVLVLNDSSSIDRCVAAKGTGGPVNEGSLVMNDASSIWGTGGVTNRGELTLNDASSIHDNLHHFHMGPGRGGGVYNEGTLTMTGASTIHDNEAASISWSPGRGGGVYNASSGILNRRLLPPRTPTPTSTATRPTTASASSPSLPAR